MTDQKPDFRALREGLPEDQWIADGPQVRLSTTVGSFWLATCCTEDIAQRMAAIPSMLEEIKRLRLLVSNADDEHDDQCHELDSLRALKTELREALKDLADAFVNPGDGGPYETGEIPPLDKARALLAKTETTS